MELRKGTRRADGLTGCDGPDRILGLAGDDTIGAGAGDDVVRGGAGADVLRGEDGADVASGGPGADTLIGGAGDDDLSGGPGLDVAAFAGPRARYAITVAEDGTTTVRDYAADGDGVDRLRGVERLRFADELLELRALPEANAPVVLSQVAEGQGGGFAILGGRDARPAGDVNGDGLGDLLVTGADGAAHVVFGKADTKPLDLADIAAGLGGGFRVGGSGGAFAVPDLNGDGRAEILANGGPDGPALVFGKTDAAPVDLAAVAGGEGGYAILNETGRPPLTATGVLPDVTGDGLAEFLLASPAGPGWIPPVYFAPPYNAAPPDGRAYVAFGVPEGPIRLDEVARGEGGLLLEAGSAFSSRNIDPITLAPIADMNDDGLADLLVRENSSDAGGYHRYTIVFSAGEASRILLDDAAAGEGGVLATVASYGPHSTSRVVRVLDDPDGSGPGGIAITDGPLWGVPGPATGFTTTIGGDLPPGGGPRSPEWRGATGVVAVADLDGDGRPELLLGGYTVGDVPGVPFPVQTGQASYLVHSGGGELLVSGPNNRPAGTVADLSGDGLPELLLLGEEGGYVLFGGSETGTLDLAATAAQGIDGVAIQGDVVSLRSAPDLNGDGRPELLAQGTDGTTYVVFADPLWAA